MPSACFYGAPQDLADILRFAVDDLTLELREMYSALNEPLRRFDSADEAINALDVGVDPWGRGDSTLLALWAPRLGPAHVERLRLRTAGEPLREEFVGWGVIYLYCGGLHERAITPSRYAVNSEKRVRAREEVSADRLGVADSWDWTEVDSTARKLRYHIARRLAVGKIGNGGVHYVLREADRLARGAYALTDGAKRPLRYP